MHEHVRAGGAIAQEESAGSGEILTFRLGAESYGIDILKVQEIRSYEPPTVLANAPAHIKGVIDLRGAIVPILDLRIRFGLPQAAYDAFTVVVILNLAQGAVGVVVDAVRDVLSLPHGSVQPPPQFATYAFDAAFIRGLATLDGSMVILLDVDRLVTGADMAVLDGAAA